MAENEENISVVISHNNSNNNSNNSSNNNSVLSMHSLSKTSKQTYECKENIGRYREYLERFRQQRLKAWQPIITPNNVIFSFFVIGFSLVTIGILLCVSHNSVSECSVSYPDPQRIGSSNSISVIMEKSNCIGLDSDTIESDHIMMYYELENFYQNHRRILNSLMPKQLGGQVYTDPDSLTRCEPRIESTTGKILSPCGLLAGSVFNDTFTISETIDNNLPPESSNLRIIQLDESPEAITFEPDYKYRYKNPTPTSDQEFKIDQWLDPSIFPGKVENPHFINWMRPAALSTFRKTYGKIVNKSVQLPLVVNIQNRYPVSSMNGKKTIVISTTTWTGARNPFLCIFYLVLGVFLWIIGTIFHCKNRRNPRILGDIRYLKWNQKNN